jgi:ATP phosphoribosyltransferase
MIKIGLPKGRMTSQSQTICRALGVEMTPGVLRYRAQVGGCSVGLYLLKAPDIAGMLATSALDLGLTGDEWLLEHRVGRQRWYLEGGSYVASVCLLMAEDDRRSLRWIRSVVTPYPNLARALVGDLAPDSRIMTVTGSSEGLVPDVGDACLDVVETGSTAALNRLVVRQNFQRVTTHFARSDRARPDAITPILDVIAAAKTSEA